MSDFCIPYPQSSALSTGPQIIQAWQVRAAEWERLGVSVNGAKLCQEVVADLHAMQCRDQERLTLAEASDLGGYDVDSLGRLLRAGTIENVGRKGAPRIRRRDVPVRPGHQRADEQKTSTSTDTLVRSIVAARSARR